MQRLSPGHEVWGTLRGNVSDAPEIQGIDHRSLIQCVPATNPALIRQALDQVGPDIVINCIGIVKQSDEAKNAVVTVGINALLPHQLTQLCGEVGARLIHFSTDCVFSGHDGPYCDTDPPDPMDLYGRSKLLGEVESPGCLTIRTSIVGRELKRGRGLFDWFFSQKGGRVRGYRCALYSGLTTLAMAEVVQMLIECHSSLSGIWQVSGDPIDKFSLLELVNKVYRLGIHVEPDETFQCDRRLDSSYFREATNWAPPTWQSMIESMQADPLR